MLMIWSKKSAGSTCLYTVILFQFLQYDSTFIATPSPEKKIAYKTFFVLKECLAIIGRLLCLVAQILLLTFLENNGPRFHVHLYTIV